MTGEQPAKNSSLSPVCWCLNLVLTEGILLMTVSNSGTLRRSVARLSSDELDVLEKLGQDSATVNLDITLKPVTWIALQKYAHKHECSLAEAVESGLEDSEQVASGIEIRLGDV